MFSYIHIISVNGVDHHMADFELQSVKEHTHRNVPLPIIKMRPCERRMSTFIDIQI